MCKENDSYKIITDEQIKNYEKLVYKIVNRMNYGYVDKEDLIQAGFLGLVKALQKYDDNKSESFISYASIYIISSIKEELRNNKLIVLNKDIISVIRKIKDYERFSIDEVSKELNVSKEKVFYAYLYKDNITSLDKEDGTVIDLIQSKNENKITEMLPNLNEKERKLIYYKYFYNYNQSEIALKLNKSQSSISRLETKALNKLKELVLNN